MSEDWEAKVEQEKKKIKEWSVTDRLSIVSKLSFMNGSLASSVTGWHSWLTNPGVMEQLNKEELEELVAEFEKLALEFLELDLKYTKLVKEKQEKEKKSLDIQAKKKKANYIA